jgi:hypothetical protein
LLLFAVVTVDMTSVGFAIVVSICAGVGVALAVYVVAGVCAAVEVMMSGHRRQVSGTAQSFRKAELLSTILQAEVDRGTFLKPTKKVE